MKWDELPNVARRAILQFVERRDLEGASSPRVEAYEAMREVDWWPLHRDPEVAEAWGRVLDASLEMMELLVKKHEGVMRLAQKRAADRAIAGAAESRARVAYKAIFGNEIERGALGDPGVAVTVHYKSKLLRVEGPLRMDDMDGQPLPESRMKIDVDRDLPVLDWWNGEEHRRLIDACRNIGEAFAVIGGAILQRHCDVPGIPVAPRRGIAPGMEVIVNIMRPHGECSKHACEAQRASHIAKSMLEQEDVGACAIIGVGNLYCVIHWLGYSPMPTFQTETSPDMSTEDAAVFLR